MKHQVLERCVLPESMSECRSVVLFGDAKLMNKLVAIGSMYGIFTYMNG